MCGPILQDGRHDWGWPKGDGAKPAPMHSGTVDREAFNYGRALGTPSTAEYRAFARITAALGKIAQRFVAAHWRLEMALRDVRNACTADEQDAAMRALRIKIHGVDREISAVVELPLRFYRFGRIGDVLKNFSPKL